MCGGDAELRQQVERLLSAHPGVGNFLMKPVAEQLIPAPELAAEAGAGREGPNSTRADGEDDILAILQPSTRPGALGRLGHYDVLQVVGRGGFGIVLRAFDDTLERVVAVKVLAPLLAATSPARKRFLREARSSARVRHENVVHVYAVEEQPLPYLVMEYFPGETLQQRLDRMGPLDAAETVHIGRQIALGLAAAHATGLIHRDIKPANIMVEAGPHPRVIITDFGLARAADDASLTQSGMVAGTPMFMAPEQASGEALDHRVDLFSLGSVLYMMCSGRPPFRAANTLAVLKRVAEDTPRPIREIIPEVPQWLCDVIARLHAKKPADRISSAREVADLLVQPSEARQELESAPMIPVPPPSVEVTQVPSRIRRLNRSRGLTIAAVLLLLGSALGFTESTGVTNMRGPVIRLFAPEGTLVVEVDDPGVAVTIDGSDIVITGAGLKEIRLKPGDYTLEASKDGKVVRRELVTVAKNGRQVVRVSREEPPPVVAPATVPPPDATAWERSVAALPETERNAAISARLKELNPGYSGKIKYPGHDEIDLSITGPELRLISPVRAMPGLRWLHIDSPNVSDLSPLRGLELTCLILSHSSVSDLTPLRGMKTLRIIDLTGSTKIEDLSPLSGLPLDSLSIAATSVSDLTPFRGSKLSLLNCDSSKVTDLSPLKGVRLTTLMVHNTRVADLSPLEGMPLTKLVCDNSLVSDASLVHLRRCTDLRSLYLRGTKVTAAGVKELAKALPRCKIEWDGGTSGPK